MASQRYTGPAGFEVATDYRPFAARYNPRAGFQADRDTAAIKPIQVGLIGRIYRMTTLDAVALIADLREQLAAGTDRVRVLIAGDKWARPNGSSGSRRAATRDEARSLVRDLVRAVEEAGDGHLLGE